MGLRDALFLENAGAVYNARDYRGLFRRVFDDRQGILAAGDLAVSQRVVPGMGVLVATGAATVRAAGILDGLYFQENVNAAVDLALSPSHATLPRRDLIVLRIRDTEGGSASDAGTLEVIEGTPAASPADPAVPAQTIVLARVAVAAGVTTIGNGNITDQRTQRAGQELVGPQRQPKLFEVTLVGGPTVAAVEFVLGTLTIPAQPFAYNALPSAHWSANPTPDGADDNWLFRIRDTNTAGFERGAARFSQAGGTGASRFAFAVPNGEVRAVPINTAATFVATITRDAVNGVGGTVTTATAGRLSALILPV